MAISRISSLILWVDLGCLSLDPIKFWPLSQCIERICFCIIFPWASPAHHPFLYDLLTESVVFEYILMVEKKEKIVFHDM